MPYMHASDRATADQHHRVADNDPVAALQRQFGSAWVWEAYVMATGEEVNLLGLISNCLLVVRGTMQLVRNRTSTIDETRVAFGRKH
jgi:hypothetical protein